MGHNNSILPVHHCQHHRNIQTLTVNPYGDYEEGYICSECGLLTELVTVTIENEKGLCQEDVRLIPKIV